MRQVRPPAVAGRFYPSDPFRLREQIRGLLARKDPQGPPPKAVIAPHAGYVFSGPVAAAAFARLGLGRARIRRIVLLGPAHQAPVRSLAVCGADGFATPLGVVPVDPDGLQALLDLPEVATDDGAHAFEHSLEVELPFLQEVLGDFTLVPALVGAAGPLEVAGALERVWGGEETAIVVSSDLSHYLPQTEARQRDRATALAIRDLRPAALDPESACGLRPVQGLLLAAAAHGLRGEILEVRNSGDTAGGKRRVVGYGAFAFA